MRVTTRSGHRRDEAPSEVAVGERSFQVTRVLESWIEVGPARGSPEIRVYRVLLEDGREMVLEHHYNRDVWSQRP